MYKMSDGVMLALTDTNHFLEGSEQAWRGYPPRNEKLTPDPEKKIHLPV